MQELQYCAATVTQCLADHGFGAETPPLGLPMRKQLFEVCTTWCADAPSDVRERMMSYSLSKVRDSEARSTLELDMARSTEALRISSLQVRSFHERMCAA